MKMTVTTTVVYQRKKQMQTREGREAERERESVRESGRRKESLFFDFVMARFLPFHLVQLICVFALTPLRRIVDLRTGRACALTRRRSGDASVRVRRVSRLFIGDPCPPFCRARCTGSEVPEIRVITSDQRRGERGESVGSRTKGRGDASAPLLSFAVAYMTGAFALALVRARVRVARSRFRRLIAVSRYGSIRRGATGTTRGTSARP